MNDWTRKSDNLQEHLSTLIGSVHDAIIADSLTINRDIFLKCVIGLQKEINQMRGYAKSYEMVEKPNP